MKHTRFVVEVHDLSQAIFVEFGVLTNHRVIALLSAWNSPRTPSPTRWSWSARGSGPT